MQADPQFIADLLLFTGEILRGKLYFLFSALCLVDCSIFWILDMVFLLVLFTHVVNAIFVGKVLKTKLLSIIEILVPISLL